MIANMVLCLSSDSVFAATGPCTHEPRDSARDNRGISFPSPSLRNGPALLSYVPHGPDGPAKSEHFEVVNAAAL